MRGYLAPPKLSNQGMSCLISFSRATPQLDRDPHLLLPSLSKLHLVSSRLNLPHVPN